MLFEFLFIVWSGTTRLEFMTNTLDRVCLIMGNTNFLYILLVNVFYLVYFDRLMDFNFYLFVANTWSFYWSHN